MESKTWLTAKDLQQLIPSLSIRSAREIIKSVLDDMDREHCYRFKSKELIAPAWRLYKKLEIERK